MKLFKCNTQTMRLEVVELPRQNWKVVPPAKLTVIITLGVIVVTALVWGLS